MSALQRSHNLPAALTPLIGRELDLAAVRSTLLAKHVRLVTLTGAPGTGKTRLALASAEDVRPAFNDGAWFVPLASVQHADLVLPTIAEALGVRQMGRHPLVEALIQALANQRLLLVMDNFEHVLTAASGLLALLEACPGLKILATSRARLRVSGEHHLPVRALELPALEPLPGLEELLQVAAVRLFVERARAVRPDFQLSRLSARPVAELCVKLDGLPLAIELAAARVALFEPRELLARFEQRLSLLIDGPSDLPVRQRTLRGAIGWSYNLLSPDEQRLFRIVGAFAGGCTFEGLQTLADSTLGTHPDVLPAIEVLLDHSLVHRASQPGGDVRIDMLETVREYAIEQLANSGELETIQHQHAQYFMALAERAANPRLDGPDGPTLMSELERDHANLRAALRWLVDHRDAEQSVALAGALWSFWEKRGYWDEGRHWLELALALSGHVSAGVLGRALMGLAVMHRERSDYVSAARFGSASVDLQRELSDANSLGASLTMLADMTALAGGDPETAAALAAEATVLRQQYPAGLAWSILVQGYVAAYQGDFACARGHFESGLSIRRGHVGNEVDAQLLHGLGAMLAGAGDFTAALPLLENALGLLRTRDERRGVARVLLSLGALLARQGDAVSGRRTLEESLSLFRTLGEAVGTALCSLLLGLAVPDDLLAEVGENALIMWWRLSTGRDAPPVADPAAWRVVSERRAGPSNHVAPDPNGLTRRELEVLALIAREYSNRQIADALVLSIRTVERHITNIYAKTGLSSRRLAERYAGHQWPLPND